MQSYCVRREEVEGVQEDEKPSVLPVLPPCQASVKHSTPLASLVLTASPGIIQELRKPAFPLWDFCRCAVT